MKTRTVVVSTGIVVAMLATQAAHAGFFGGALGGAVLGDLVGGRDGAAAGAIIGGVVGASRASSQRKREKQQQAEAQRRKEEWAAQQRLEQAQYQQQQAAAAPALAASETLAIETQKSLIRMGYDPGPIGEPGNKLTQAVLEYQKSKGLLETGELSQALLTHMLQNGG